MPSRHNITTMHTSTGANVHHVVGTANRIFVVFDNQHRVAHIAQVAQGLQQAVIIALV